MGKSLFKGAMILGIAGLIVKVMGAFFRIPLGNIIESEGMGYYSTSYPVYVSLLVISTAGFPTAISKLVSEKMALKDKKGAHRIFKISFMMLFIIGIITSFILYFGAEFMVNNLFKNPKAYYSMRAIAPALFFVSLMSAYRGYFQGMQNMKPTAISQIIEQFFRVGLGLYLAIYFIKDGKDIAAAGASFGATAGAFAGSLFMFLVYFLNRKYIKKSMKKQLNEFEEESASKVITKILNIAIPITIGAAVIPMMSLIDTSIVMRRLQSSGFSVVESSELFGQLTGMAATLVNLPQVLTMAMAMSLVPLVSEYFIKKEIKKAKELTNMALKTSFLISMPAAFGLCSLSVPIMKMLFPKEPVSAGYILFFLSFGIIFLCAIQVLTGIFQGMGYAHIPVKNLFIGGILKVIVSYSLTGIKIFNVKGAAIGTITAYFVAFILNIKDMNKVMNIKINLKEAMLKSFISSFVMGCLCFLIHRSLSIALSNTLSTIISISIGMGVYFVLILKIKGITKNEIMKLPKGKNIASLLQKIKLL